MESNNSTIEKQRITWIDMAKGFGIIFVIFAHLGGGLFTTWMYSFHVPLFFILSGFTFNKETTFSTFLAKKSKSLLLPYLCLGGVILIYYVLAAIISDRFSMAFLLDLLLQFLLQRRFLTLWFITALFLLNVISYPLLKLIKNKTLLFFISLGIGIIAMVYYSLGGGYVFWNLDASFAAMPFFVIGHICKCNHENIKTFFDKKIKIFVALIIFLAVNILVLILNISIGYKVLDMYSSEYGCQPLTYLSAICGSFAIIMLSHLFTWKPIIYIGKNSLLYFAWHFNLILPIITKVLELCGITLIGYSHIVVNFIFKIILLVVILLICTVCNLIIEKTKLKFMIGK